MSPTSSGPFVLQTQEDRDGSSGSDRHLDERLLSRQTPALECLNAFSSAHKDVRQLNEEPVSNLSSRRGRGGSATRRSITCKQHGELIVITISREYRRIKMDNGSHAGVPVIASS